MKHIDCGAARAFGFWVTICVGTAFIPGQGLQLALNGQLQSPVNVSIGGDAFMEMTGPPSMPLALLIGFQAASIPTPYGLLEVNAFQPESFLILNGFDPTHYNHSVSFLDAAGSLSAPVVPFTDPGMTPGFTLHTQAVVQDPAAPFGYTLSNPLEVVATAHPPVVNATTPNYGGPGQNVFIVGDHFASEPSENTVTVDGLPCHVLISNETSLQVTLPMNARSGPVQVTTSAGPSATNFHAVETWMAVLQTPITEGSEPSVITTPTTITGHIQVAGQRDTYVLHAEAGEEIFVEAYSWDPNAQMITAAFNSVNTYFDPVLRIKRNGLVLAQDDDSGPQFNAGIGLTDGSTFFVADETADYEIELDTYLGTGNGYYIIMVGTRTPSWVPVMVQSIVPNVVQENTLVSVFATGIDPTQPGSHQVIFDGQTITPHSVSAGRIEFFMPAGTVSGPLNIATPLGATNHGNGRMASWVVVMGSHVHLEAEQKPDLTIQPGHSVVGTIASGSDQDAFEIYAVAGQRLRIECTAYDSVSGLAVTAGFLTLMPLDPDVRVATPSAPTSWLAIDGNGGPGFNALIGNGAESAYFEAPETGTYIISVVPWFGYSHGGYILNVVDVSP